MHIMLPERPFLYAITAGEVDAAERDPYALAARILAVVDGGATVIQLREKAACAAYFDALAPLVIPALAARGARLILNAACWSAWPQKLPPHGLHFGATTRDIATAFHAAHPDLPLLYSAHSADEAVHVAEEIPLSGVTLSPIYPTLSKPGHPGTGLGLLTAARPALPSAVRVVALGGITRATVPECIRAGADGVAVMRGVFSADDPRAAAAEFIVTMR